MALLPLTLTTSCEDDYADNAEEILVGDGTLRVHAYMGNTRAARTWWAIDDSIGVTGNGYHNVEYKINPSFINLFDHFAGGPIFYNNTNYNQAKYTAYYPFSGAAGTSCGIIYASTANQDSAAQAKYDFLFANPTPNYNTEVNFNFHHRMASIMLVFVDSAGQPAVVNDWLTMHLDSSLYMAGWFDTETGVATVDNSGKRLSVDTTMYVANTRTDTAIFPQKRIIIFPQADSITIPNNLYVVAKGKVYTGTLPIPIVESGNQYTYIVMIGKPAGSSGGDSKLIILSGTVEPWIPDGDAYGTSIADSTAEVLPWILTPDTAHAQGISDDTQLHPWGETAIDTASASGFASGLDVLPWNLMPDTAKATNISDGTNLHPWGEMAIDTANANYIANGTTDVLPWNLHPDTAKATNINGGTILHPWGDMVKDTASAGGFASGVEAIPWNFNPDTAKATTINTGAILHPWGQTVKDTAIADAIANDYADVLPWIMTGNYMATAASVAQYGILHPWGQTVKDTATSKPVANDYTDVIPWMMTGNYKATAPAVSDGSSTFPWRVDPGYTPGVYNLTPTP